MKKYLILFLILCILELNKCYDNKINNELLKDLINKNNTNINNIGQNSTNNYTNYLDNITITNEETDKLLFCGALLQIKVRNEEKIIDDLALELNESTKEDAYDKIGSYLMYNCYNNVKLKTARTYFSEGLYIKEIDKTDFDYYSKLHDVDYSIFKTKADLLRSDEEIDIILKFHKALEIHNKKQDEIDANRMKAEKENEGKIKAAGIDLISIPNYVKIILFIIVFGSLFGGSLYYVNSIINKPKKDKKDKKKKKKTQ